MSLRILDEIIELAPAIQRLCDAIVPRDRELADQMRRAWTRTTMNTAEAQHRRGAKGANRFDDAQGEARETHAGLRVALALGWVESEHGLAVLDQVDRVVATRYKLSHRPGLRTLRGQPRGPLTD